MADALWRNTGPALAHNSGLCASSISFPRFLAKMASSAAANAMPLNLHATWPTEVETTLLAFGPHERRERIGKLDLRIIGNPWYVRGQRGNPLALSMLTHLRGADVVHCHQQHLLATSLTATRVPRTRRRVFVTDLGGGGWDVSGYLSTDRWFDGHLHLSEYSRTAISATGARRLRT